jgi:dTDP-4-dehydrorhamnose 3,5-epimerase
MKFIDNMKVRKTDIQDLLVIEPEIYGDSRGYFFESFSKKKFEAATGVHADFVQDNESKSAYGVIRGLHFQKDPHAQAKLVRVVRGKVLDVAVDLRHDSPTYGRYHAEELSEDNHLQMFIPKGFAHGFSVLSDEAVLQYKCDGYYNPESEGGIAWNDPDLNIDWGIPAEKVILSAKDKDRQTLKEYGLTINE